MGGVGAVEFEPAETVFQIARVGEGEGFGDLDDEAAFDELEGLRVLFRVLVLILCAWYLAQDLDARFGGVADDCKQRQADTQGDAEGKRVEDCGGEDEEHKNKFRPAADVNEEFNVMGSFFNEGVANDRYHG